MSVDLIKRLRGCPVGPRGAEFPYLKIMTEAADKIGDMTTEIEKLRAKCDFQASILRRLMPDKFLDTYFIYGELGSKDQNGMPEKIMVVPAYGVDFSYIYTREEKTTGPEW